MKTGNTLRATATPLASIFGSGFLVIVPILNGAVGRYALFAMGAVCLTAYWVGSVIRHNITHAEPAIENDTETKPVHRFERASDLALIAAYIISVCLYINILASFLLGGLGDGHDTQRLQQMISIAIIAFIGVIGYTKGLGALAKMETIALLVTFLIIITLLLGFARADASALREGIVWPDTPSHSPWEILTIVGGTLIVVQGFETSRYLGEMYDQPTRVRSCRLSQIIATVVYLLFVALATPLTHLLGDTVEDNALLSLAGDVSPLLPVPLVIAAVLSQFSAAVADTLSGSGNAVESTRGHVDSRHAIVIICGLACVICVAPTLTILALASRAFAFYYMLQCLVALCTTKSTARKAGFGALGVAMLFIALFAQPAG